MGLGDWIIATVDAKHYNEKYGLPVIFKSEKTGKYHWSEVFHNNPRILKDPKPGDKFVAINNVSGSRPYIWQITPERIVYNMEFKVTPGELFLSEEERKSGEYGCVIVEPHTKESMFSRNKAWPFDRWQEVVKSIDLPWVQVGNEECQSLKGVKRVVTKSFRESLGWLNKSSLLVTTDGALHHAAAALGKKAVVLWGGLAPWSVLGYDSHTNLCMTDYACGSLQTCGHCSYAMEAITVDMVVDAIGQYLL